MEQDSCISFPGLSGSHVVLLYGRDGIEAVDLATTLSKLETNPAYSLLVAN